MVPCGHQILEPALIPLLKCGVSALSGTWVTECRPSTSPGPEPCKGDLWVESLGSRPFFPGQSSRFSLRGSKKYQAGWQRSPCTGLLQCDGCQQLNSQEEVLSGKKYRNPENCGSCLKRKMEARACRPLSSLACFSGRNSLIKMLKRPWGHHPPQPTK